MVPISISGFVDTKVKAAIFKVGEVVRYSTAMGLDMDVGTCRDLLEDEN